MSVASVQSQIALHWPATREAATSTPAGTIHPAAETDLDDLVALCALHAEYEKAAFDPEGHRERLAVALFADTPRLFAWIARALDDTAAGYVSITIDYSTWDARDFLHMDCLYLRGDQRGRGLGRAMMGVVCDFARDRAIDLIQWQTPLDNPLGIGFYGAIGAHAKPKLRYFLEPTSLSPARDAAASEQEREVLP